jgi:hypothetical protein
MTLYPDGNTNNPTFQAKLDDADYERQKRLDGVCHKPERSGGAAVTNLDYWREHDSNAAPVPAVGMPADVRAAIRAAEDALHKIRGFLPANVGVPLQSAHGKLRVAQVAVDAWEADLRLKAIEKEHDGERVGQNISEPE